MKRYIAVLALYTRYPKVPEIQTYAVPISRSEETCRRIICGLLK